MVLIFFFICSFSKVVKVGIIEQSSATSGWFAIFLCFLILIWQGFLYLIILCDTSLSYWVLSICFQWSSIFTHIEGHLIKVHISSPKQNCHHTYSHKDLHLVQQFVHIYVYEVEDLRVTVLAIIMVSILALKCLEMCFTYLLSSVSLNIRFEVLSAHKYRKQIRFSCQISCDIYIPVLSASACHYELAFFCQFFIYQKTDVQRRYHALMFACIKRGTTK